jgi:hypothetical protein
MRDGYIFLHRRVLDKVWASNPDYLSLWVHLLLHASYVETNVMTKGGALIHILPGQLITSRLRMQQDSGINQFKIERILKFFKSEQQIAQQNHGKFRVITILNWSDYQVTAQENAQHLHNRCTTDAQQAHTLKKVLRSNNKVEEVKDKPSSSSGDNGKGAFATFWSEYPRKIGKGSAERAWKKIKQPAETLPSILSALSWQKVSEQWQRNNGQFIPHPATYLNQRRWEDERDPGGGGGNRLDRIFGGDDGSGIS